MRFYKTLRAVQFAGGTLLALDANQAGRRGHVLEPVEDGVYRALDGVMFKRGETIGLIGAPKGDSGLEPVELEPAIKQPEQTPEANDGGKDADDTNNDATKATETVGLNGVMGTEVTTDGEEADEIATPPARRSRRKAS